MAMKFVVSVPRLLDTNLMQRFAERVFSLVE
jgi:hypothetical protein